MSKCKNKKQETLDQEPKINKPSDRNILVTFLNLCVIGDLGSIHPISTRDTVKCTISK